MVGVHQVWVDYIFILSTYIHEHIGLEEPVPQQDGRFDRLESVWQARQVRPQQWVSDPEGSGAELRHDGRVAGRGVLFVVTCKRRNKS